MQNGLALSMSNRLEIVPFDLLWNVLQKISQLPLPSQLTILFLSFALDGKMAPRKEQVLHNTLTGKRTMLIADLTLSRPTDLFASTKSAISYHDFRIPADPDPGIVDIIFPLKLRQQR